MPLKNRTDLRAKFRKGLRPSEDDFADVIGSTLNKRDDQFFGKWRPGTVYRQGDVVIFNRTLWQVRAEQDICSHTPPELGEDWRSLIVPVGDEDWFVIEDPDDPEAFPILMVANDKVDCVGIGTFKPQAKLDVVEAGNSRFLLGPKAAACTTFTLVNLKNGEQEKTYLITGLDANYASWLSDVPGGFVFRHGDSNAEGEQDQLDCHDGDLLMVIQPDTGGLVRVGIGTGNPSGMLDVTDGGKGQFVLNPEDKQDPVFTIVNLAPGDAQNYLASGVGAEKAVFVTDAPDGFVFNRGDEYGDFNSEENINQGDLLVCIAPEGKLGVAMAPEDYQLDVNGLTRVYVPYVNTDRDNVKNLANIGSVLQGVLNLKPRRFQWRVATGFEGEGDQFGLVGQEVEDIFPEVVRTNPEDDTKAVTYPGLVAVVVGAVQEQQVLIVALQNENAQQQNQIGALQTENAQQQSQIINLQEENTQQQGQINALEAENGQQQAQINALQTDNAQQQTQLDDLKADGAQQQAQINALEAENGQQQADIAALQTENAQQQSQIDELKADSASQGARIVALQNENAQQQQDIEKLQQLVAEILERLDQIESKL